MKIKRLMSLILSFILMAGICVLPASAALPFESGVDALREQFEKGVGPETEGFAIDYRYYSPVNESDDTKYPLVIWLHGMGDGEYEGKQISTNNVSYWSSAEYQSRFKDSEGAFILIPRSVEEKELYWTDNLIYPLRAAIDDFILKNKTNIDISRIYIGGYSMGGKMTLKMAVAYPELFAAIFPICPAWAPDKEAAAKLKDIPVWLTSGKTDPLVSYRGLVMPTWNNILATASNPDSCRLSSLSLTAYANAVPCVSAHFSWFAVNNDMFSDRDGKYPFMSTVNGKGEKVTLTYPDGMISWLSSFESDYDGAPATDSGNEEATNPSAHLSLGEIIKQWFRNIFDFILSFFRK